MMHACVCLYVCVCMCVFVCVCMNVCTYVCGLGVVATSVIVSGFSAGSIVAEFWLLPSNNPAEAGVRQLVATLRMLQGRPLSALYAGTVTHAVDPDPAGITATYHAVAWEKLPSSGNITATTVAALTDDDEGDVVPVTVRAFQVAGLFQFTTAEVRAAEGTDVTLTVARLHGTRGNVALRVATVGETAHADAGDFEPLDSVLRFSDGETSQTVTVRGGAGGRGMFDGIAHRQPRTLEPPGSLEQRFPR